MPAPTSLLVAALFASSGFTPESVVGDSCVDALHELHHQERMEIISTVVQDVNLVYTLSSQGSHRWRHSKMAILMCAAPEPEDDGDDTGTGDEEPDV